MEMEQIVRLKAGWLIMVPEERSIYHNYKRKYFVFSKIETRTSTLFQLHYYKDLVAYKKRDIPKGVIDISTARHIGIGLEKLGRYKHLISVELPEERFYLSTSCCEDRFHWCIVLRAYRFNDKSRMTSNCSPIYCSRSEQGFHPMYRTYSLQTVRSDPPYIHGHSGRADFLRYVDKDEDPKALKIEISNEVIRKRFLYCKKCLKSMNKGKYDLQSFHDYILPTDDTDESMFTDSLNESGYMSIFGPRRSRDANSLKPVLPHSGLDSVRFSGTYAAVDEAEYQYVSTSIPEEMVKQPPSTEQVTFENHINVNPKALTVPKAFPSPEQSPLALPKRMGTKELMDSMPIISISECVPSRSDNKGSLKDRDESVWQCVKGRGSTCAPGRGRLDNVGNPGHYQSISIPREGFNLTKEESPGLWMNSSEVLTCVSKPTQHASDTTPRLGPRHSVSLPIRTESAANQKDVGYAESHPVEYENVNRQRTRHLSIHGRLGCKPSHENLGNEQDGRNYESKKKSIEGLIDRPRSRANTYDILQSMSLSNDSSNCKRDEGSKENNISTVFAKDRKHYTLHMDKITEEVKQDVLTNKQQTINKRQSTVIERASTLYPRTKSVPNIAVTGSIFNGKSLITLNRGTDGLFKEATNSLIMISSLAHV